MGEICGAKPELTYPERTIRLTRAGIALWDVLIHCEREGSLDNKISKDTEVPNDFNEFLQYHLTVELIGFNGRKAAKSFNKLVAPSLPTDLLNRIAFIILPSTSSLNRTISRTEKLVDWAQAITPFLSLPA
jgi:TDG/mug DNA glycosylase family protein